MNDSYILLTVLVQIFLTFWLYIYLAIAKKKALKLGQVDEKRRALHEDAWPESVMKINNCIRSQFEMPVIFYVLVISLMLTNSVNLYLQILAWAFVLSRVAHAIIHTGSNYVPTRRKLFMVGSLLLIVLSLNLAYSIIVM